MKWAKFICALAVFIAVPGCIATMPDHAGHQGAGFVVFSLMGIVGLIGFIVARFLD
jgi:hypothetical protein